MIRVLLLMLIFACPIIHDVYATCFRCDFALDEIEELVEAGLSEIYPEIIDELALMCESHLSTQKTALKVFEIGTRKSSLFDSEALACVEYAKKNRDNFEHQLGYHDYEEPFDQALREQFNTQLSSYSDAISNNCKNKRRDSTRNLAELHISDRSLIALVNLKIEDVFSLAYERALVLMRGDSIRALIRARDIIGALLENNAENIEPLALKLAEKFNDFSADKFGDNGIDEFFDDELFTANFTQQRKAHVQLNARHQRASLLIQLFNKNPIEPYKYKILKTLEALKIYNDKNSQHACAHMYQALVNVGYAPAFDPAYDFVTELFNNKYDDDATELILSLLNQNITIPEKIIKSLAGRNSFQEQIPLSLYSAVVSQDNSAYYSVAASFLESDDYTCSIHSSGRVDITAGKFTLCALLVEHGYKNIFEHAKKTLLNLVSRSKCLSFVSEETLHAAKKLVNALASQRQITIIEEAVFTVKLANPDAEPPEPETQPKPTVPSSGGSSQRDALAFRIISSVHQRVLSFPENIQNWFVELMKEYPHYSRPALVQPGAYPNIVKTLPMYGTTMPCPMISNNMTMGHLGQ